MRNNFILGLNSHLLPVGPRKCWQTDKPYWKATISLGKQIQNPNKLNTNPNWSVQFFWTDLHHHILTFWFAPSQGWSGIISGAMYRKVPHATHTHYLDLVSFQQLLSYCSLFKWNFIFNIWQGYLAGIPYKIWSLLVLYQKTFDYRDNYSYKLFECWGQLQNTLTSDLTVKRCIVVEDVRSIYVWPCRYPLRNWPYFMGILVWSSA